MTIPSTKQLHLSVSTALCIYSTTPSLSYWSILTLMEHFQHVRSTSYLLKAFGILYVLIQPGHKYSTPPSTLCQVTACVFHIGVLTLLVLGDDSNLLWNFFNMPRLHSSRWHCFFHTHILILGITHHLQFTQGQRYQSPHHSHKCIYGCTQRNMEQSLPWTPTTSTYCSEQYRWTSSVGAAIHPWQTRSLPTQKHSLRTEIIHVLGHKQEENRYHLDNHHLETNHPLPPPSQPAKRIYDPKLWLNNPEMCEMIGH